MKLRRCAEGQSRWEQPGAPEWGAAGLEPGSGCAPTQSSFFRPSAANSVRKDLGKECICDSAVVLLSTKKGSLALAPLCWWLLSVHINHSFGISPWQVCVMRGSGVGGCSPGFRLFCSGALPSPPSLELCGTISCHVDWGAYLEKHFAGIHPPLALGPRWAGFPLT